MFHELNSGMLQSFRYSRKHKTFVAVYSKGGIYTYTGVSRYRRDAVASGKIGGSVGKSMHHYILGQFPYQQVA